jgi:hypothetical protein
MRELGGVQSCDEICMVTIKRHELVALLKDIGFADAESWEDTKLCIRAPQIPKRFPLEKIPEQHWGVYAFCMTAMVSNDVVTLEVTKEARKAQFKARNSKRTPRQPTPVDFLGCKVGTISAKVNDVLAHASNWIDEKEIAEAAGLSLDQTRGRLYFAVLEGHFIKRTRVEYQLAPNPKSKRR